MNFLIGILAIASGLAICFAGLRLWFLLLPLFAFVAGFTLSATAVASLWDNHIFLATTTAVITGFVVGIIFALISYFWWYFGVILASGFTGASLAAGLGRLLNIHSDWLLFIFSLVGGILVVAIALLVALPIYLVIINSAIGGAFIAITGILLLFSRVTYGELGYGTARAAIDDSWWWSIVLIVLAIAGVMSQLRQVAEAVLPEEKWTQVTISA